MGAERLASAVDRASSSAKAVPASPGGGDRHRLLCRLVVDPLHQASEDTGLVGRWQRLPDRHERFGSNSGSQLLDMPQVHRKTAIIMQL